MRWTFLDHFQDTCYHVKHVRCLLVSRIQNFFEARIRSGVVGRRPCGFMGGDMWVKVVSPPRKLHGLSNDILCEKFRSPNFSQKVVNQSWWGQIHWRRNFEPGSTSKLVQNDGRRLKIGNLVSELSINIFWKLCDDIFKTAKKVWFLSNGFGTFWGLLNLKNGTNTMFWCGNY